MDKNRLKEILKSLSSNETKEMDRIDLMNEILDGFNAVDTTEYETKLKESEEKYAALEQRYKDTFFKKLEVETPTQTTQDSSNEESTTTATLEDVIKARNTFLSATTKEDEMKANGELTNAISKLFALAESYPDLKANENFIKKQMTLAFYDDIIYNCNVISM